jgi:hypothetical protein
VRLGSARPRPTRQAAETLGHDVANSVGQRGEGCQESADLQGFLGVPRLNETVHTALGKDLDSRSNKALAAGLSRRGEGVRASNAGRKRVHRVGGAQLR